MKKKIFTFSKKLLGFTLIELTITMVVIAIAVAAFAPVITKRMKNTSTSVVGLSTKCTKISPECQLCDKTGCVWCGLSRSIPNNYVDESTCTHKACAGNCIRCTGPGANCTQCDSGYYLSSGSCLACPAGKYCLGGNKAPISCPAGTYQASAGAHNSCTKCPVGKYQSSDNQTSCLECNKGTYQNATGQKSCISCPAGSYSSSNNATSCTQCAVGTYQGSAGQSSCTTCAAGTYQDAVGQTSCITCPVNHACSGGSSITACGIGQGANGGNSACASCPTQCYDCQNTAKCEYCKGGYFLNGSSLCQGCQAGNYCPANTKRTSYVCPTGTFSLANAETCTACTAPCTSCTATACLTCPLGYTPDGTGCKLAECDPGKYINEGTCRNCLAGNYCPGGTSGPLTCPVNTWSLNSASSCTACAAGFVAPAGSNNNACQSCADKYGSTCATCNQSKCLTCTSGYIMNVDTANQACMHCNTWHTNCSSCTSSGCSTCDSGWYLNSATSKGSACVSCRNTTSHHANCATCNKDACISCDLGWDVSGKKCEQPGCNMGEYRNSSGACEPCPKGHRCLGGTNDKEKCDIHHFQPQTGQEMCIPCLWGACFGWKYPNQSDQGYYRLWLKSHDNRERCVNNTAQCDIGAWTVTYSNTADYSTQTYSIYYKGTKYTMAWGGTDAVKCKRSTTEAQCKASNKCTSGFCYSGSADNYIYQSLVGNCKAYIYGLKADGTVNGACK